MSILRVALRRRSDGSIEELGLVDGDANGKWLVRTADGTVTEVPKGNVLVPPYGSVNHLLHTRSGELKELALRDFARVAKQLLADHEATRSSGSSPGLGWKELKQKLEQVVPPGTVEPKTFTAVQRELKGDADVIAKGNPIVYSIRKGVELSLLDVPDPTPSTEDEGPEAGKLITEPEPLEEPAVVQPSLGAEVEPESEKRQTLSAVLGTMGISGDHVRDRRALATGILHVSRELSAAHVKALRRQDFEEVDQHQLWLLLAARGERLQGLIQPSADHLQAALVQAFAEAARSRKGPSAKSAERLANVVFTEVVDWDIPQLVDLARSALQWMPAPSPAVAGHLVEAFSRAVARSARELPSVTQLAPVARLAERLTLEEGSPRVAMLMSLGRRDATTLADSMWWKMSFADLVEAGRGELSRMLELPDMATKIVGPTVTAAIDSAQSRASLASVMGAPPCLARHVDAGQIAAAWARVAQTDGAASAWLDVLQDKRGVAALRGEISDLKQGLQEEELRRSELETRLAESVAQVTRVSAQLTAALAESGSTSSAELGQARLDVLRSLSSVAALALVGARAHADAALEQKVLFQTAREGLTPISMPGDSVRFDPTVHDSLGAMVDVNHPVLVIRPGYTLDRSNEDTVVLLKAQVAAESEGT